MNEKKSTCRVEIKKSGTPPNESYGWEIYKNLDVLPILVSESFRTSGDTVWSMRAFSGLRNEFEHRDFAPDGLINHGSCTGVAPNESYNRLNTTQMNACGR